MKFKNIHEQYKKDVFNLIDKIVYGNELDEHSGGGILNIEDKDDSIGFTIIDVGNDYSRKMIFNEMQNIANKHDMLCVRVDTDKEIIERIVVLKSK